MKKALLLPVLLFGASLFLYGQANKDYILTLKGDTLFGEVKYAPFAEVLTFTHKRKKFSFRPGALTYFGIYKKGTYRHFKSIRPNGNELLFAQVLDEGKLKLYFYQHKDKRYPPPHIRRLYFIGPSDRHLATISTRSYGPVIKHLFKDYPSLSKKAANATFDNVVGIVNSYNRL